MALPKIAEEEFNSYYLANNRSSKTMKMLYIVSGIITPQVLEIQQQMKQVLYKVVVKNFASTILVTLELIILELQTQH